MRSHYAVPLLWLCTSVWRLFKSVLVLWPILGHHSILWFVKIHKVYTRSQRHSTHTVHQYTGSTLQKPTSLHIHSTHCLHLRSGFPSTPPLTKIKLERARMAPFPPFLKNANKSRVWAKSRKVTWLWSHRWQFADPELIPGLVFAFRSLVSEGQDLGWEELW